MTLFDGIAIGLLMVSGLIGYLRGATREVTTVVAFVLAAIGAAFGLRFAGPMARHAIHPAWIANLAAILILFILLYIGLRLVGGAVTRTVRATGLSSLDRALGFAVGLVRAVVVLGAFALLMQAATPPERMPGWITHARLYPLAQAAGQALKSFAPRGLKVAHDIGPLMDNAVTNSVTPPDFPMPRAPTRHPGYTDDQRKALDDLVEKSR